jgi:hypothetical protein
MVLVGMAMLFAKHENVHSVCLGGAFGVLLGYTVFSFGIKSIVLRHAEQTSDVHRYPIV